MGEFPEGISSNRGCYQGIKHFTHIWKSSFSNPGPYLEVGYNTNIPHLQVGYNPLILTIDPNFLSRDIQIYV